MLGAEARTYLPSTYRYPMRAGSSVRMLRDGHWFMHLDRCHGGRIGRRPTRTDLRLGAKDDSPDDRHNSKLE